MLLAWVRRGLAALVAVFMLAAAPAARAEWLRAETDLLIVHSDLGEKRTRAFIEELHAFDGALRTLFGVAPAPADRPLQLVLAADRDVLFKLAPDLGERAAGFYAAGPGATFAVAYGYSSGYAGEGLSGKAVLLHEYAHHFMYQNFRAYFPSWFVEGFAEFVSTAAFTATEVQFGAPPSRDRLEFLRREPIPASQWMLSREDGRLSERARFARYAQGWLATHYFYTDADRLDRLLAYLRAINAQPGAERSAFEPAIGLSFEGFDQELRSYAAGRLSIMALPIDARARPEIRLRELSAVESETLLPALRLQRGRPKDAPLEETGKILQRHPGEALALRTHAQALSWANRFDEAATLLDQAIAAAPQDVLALHLRGLIEVLAARKDREGASARRALAREYLGRAIARDPNYYPSHLHLAEAADGPAARSASLLAAWRLAPQVDLIGGRLAEDLMRQGRFAEAATVLRPIAARPHGTNAKRAQQLLAAAEAGAPPPEEAETEDGEEKQPAPA